MNKENQIGFCLNYSKRDFFTFGPETQFSDQGDREFFNHLVFSKIQMKPT